jgi:hypothetical protein
MPLAGPGHDTHVVGRRNRGGGRGVVDGGGWGLVGVFGLEGRGGVGGVAEGRTCSSGVAAVVLHGVVLRASFFPVG